MTKFKITKNEIKRMGAVDGLAKTVSGAAALSDKQLFVVDSTDKKLTVFYSGESMSGGAQVRARYDVSDFVADATITDPYFTTTVSQLLASANKVDGDVVSVSIDHKNHNRLTISGEGKTKVSLTPAVEEDEDVVEEAKEYLEAKTTSKEFDDGISLVVSEAAFASMTSLANATKVIDMVKDMKWTEGGFIEAADEFAAVWLGCERDAESAENVYINRNLVPLFKNAKNVKVWDENERSFYAEYPDLGASVYVRLPDLEYEQLDEQDLEDLCPAADRRLVFTVDGKALTSALDKFEGLFDAAGWKFKPFKLAIEKESLDEGEVILHYDDFTAECTEYLKVNVVENSEPEESYEVMLSALNVSGTLRKQVEDAKSVKFTLNSLKPSKKTPHSISVLIELEDDVGTDKIMHTKLLD
jgi:hypothetical protein